MWEFLADLTVVIHFSYVAFVVVGQVLILSGAILGWNWIRYFWFRLAHLAAIGIVALEELADWRCPLTIWEEFFRTQAGQPFSGDTFLSRLIHSIMFYEWEPWVFTWLHLGFAILVIATFLFIPPHRPQCCGHSHRSLS